MNAGSTEKLPMFIPPAIGLRQMQALLTGCLRSLHISLAKVNAGSQERLPTFLPYAIGWSELRDALLRWLPKGTLQLGKRFASLEQQDSHVVVHFADGTAISANIVVGADGCFSQVRQHTLADGPPDSTVRSVLSMHI